MFEKQYNIKDKLIFKNKVSEKLSGYNTEFQENSLIIKNNKGKTIFSGEISLDPMGVKLKGEFSIQKILSKIAFGIVTVYILFLLSTYFIGNMFYDYQIFLMILAAISIVIIKKISEIKISDLKKLLESID